MTTALVTHADCLGHVNPPGHPERVERLRRDPGGAGGRGVRLSGPGRGAAGERRGDPAGASGATTWRRSRRRCRRRGFAAIDADTFLAPRHARGGAAGGGGGGAGRRHGDGGRGQERLLRRAPARAPCRDGDGHGLLLLRQRGDRGAACARGARARAGGDRRLRRAPRQRHPGPRVGRPRASCFASTHQMPLYPGHRRARRRRGAHGQIVNVPLPPGASGGGLPRRHAAAGCCRRSRRTRRR